MGSFETLYNSGWHHPGAAWLGTTLVNAWFVRQRNVRPLYFLLLAEIALDAYFTGVFSPVPAASPWYSRISIAFVILGDWRYFFLVENVRSSWRYAIPLSLGVAWFLPLTTGLVSQLWPHAFDNPRHAYLFWEVAMVILTAVYAMRITRWRLSPTRKRQAWGLTAWVGATYLLWVLADVIILQGHDAGYLLRLIPNLFYYVGFVAVAHALESPHMEDSERLWKEELA